MTDQVASIPQIGDRVRVNSGAATGRCGRVTRVDARFVGVLVDGRDADSEYLLFEIEPAPDSIAWTVGERAIVKGGAYEGSIAYLRHYDRVNDGWLCRIGGDIVAIHASLLGRPEAPADPPAKPAIEPFVLDILRGAGLWQQAEPGKRDVAICLRGHVVTVSASPEPGAEAFAAKFLGPLRASAVGAALDLVIANGDPEPFPFGGHHPDPWLAEDAIDPSALAGITS